MRRLVQCSGFWLIVALSLIPATASAETVADANCSQANNQNFTGSRRFVQTFTAEHTGRLTVAQLSVSSFTNGDDFTIGVMSLDGSGVPTGTFLASAALPDVNGSGSLPVNLTAIFSSPAAVVAGGTYGLSVEIAPGQAYISRATAAASGCSGTYFVDSSATNVFGPIASADMLYKTFVEVAPPAQAPAPVAPPAPSTPSLAAVPTSITAARFLKGIKVTLPSGTPTAFQAALRGTVKRAQLSAFNLDLATASLALGTGARSVILKPKKRLVGSLRRRTKVRLAVTATNAAGVAVSARKTITVKPRKAKR
jgi:hypothetical protein